MREFFTLSPRHPVTLSPAHFLMSTTLCDLCHAREATVFVSKIAGNNLSKHRLCAECARRAARADEFVDEAQMSDENISLQDVMNLLRDSDALELNAKSIVSPLDSLMQDKDLPLDLSLGEFPSDEDEVDAMDEDAMDEMEREFSGSDEFDGGAFIANMDLENDPFAEESDPFSDAASHEEDAASDEKPALLSGSDAIFGLDSGAAGDRDFSSARCPKCGTTWDRLRQDGRAGCAQCYATFASQLADVMGRVQKASQHAGKAPRALEKRQRRLVHLRARRDSRLELLNRRLKDSVAREKYEEAAQLRDKIKLLASTIVED